MYSLSKDARETINEKNGCDKDKMSNKSVKDDLFATISIGAILPLMGATIAFTNEILTVHCLILCKIGMILTLMSFLWAIHIVLHLFSFRSIL